jgi:hypothetical protein
MSRYIVFTATVSKLTIIINERCSTNGRKIKICGQRILLGEKKIPWIN